MYSYGHRLATCVNGAYRLIRNWNEIANGLHSSAQVVGNQVQNVGLGVLAQTEMFDGRIDLPTAINRQFRDLLKNYLAYRERFDGFLEDISLDVLDTIRDLISCDVDLEEDFQREVTTDLQRAHNCATLNP